MSTAHVDTRLSDPARVQEVLCAPQVYDGKAADVWSCAVHLYIMLVGWYPFTDPREPKNFSKTASNITRVRYAFPSGLQISDECKELIKRMFVRDPAKRITIPEIQAHPWYRKNLSREMAVRAPALASPAGGTLHGTQLGNVARTVATALCVARQRARLDWMLRRAVSCCGAGREGRCACRRTGAACLAIPAAGRHSMRY